MDDSITLYTGREYKELMRFTMSIGPFFQCTVTYTRFMVVSGLADDAIRCRVGDDPAEPTYDSDIY